MLWEGGWSDVTLLGQHHCCIGCGVLLGGRMVGCDLVLEILIRDALISTSNLSAHGNRSNHAEIYTCISIEVGRT